jgi:wyosine [tRNA(Phe)-imidazoG37] synthetase (radical SAM superfamily)
LGINNIPPKICSYSCIYCQVGRTNRKQVHRNAFYDPLALFEEVAERVRQVQGQEEPIDYLTIVPDGEPTLDSRLGAHIQLLQTLGPRVAVITNSSLLGRADVRNDLAKADWVSLKVDTTQVGIWYKINRSHPGVYLRTILEGLVSFSKEFRGQLVTETMLVKDVNDSEEHLRSVADFLAQIEPSKAYLSIPTRPPAERWVRPPDEAVINRAYQIVSERVDCECLLGYEGNDFTTTGDVVDDLLSTTAVHPMREDAVQELLEKSDKGWSTIERLTKRGDLVKVEYQGQTFYMKSLRSRSDVQELAV